MTGGIQWFPGHMAKTRRMIRESLTQVDGVVEILDARIPESSRNPELAALCGGKPRLLLLGKSDLADEAATRRWVEYFGARGFPALAADCKSGRGLQAFVQAVRRMLSEKLERYAAAGMAGRPVRLMVVGIPNCGKSTFINRLAGERRARAEDRPGVTRGKQWIALDNGIELMDTPGILWPKFEDPSVGEKLALVGSIRDEVLDTELLASRLLEILAAGYPASLARFKLEGELPVEGYELLRLVALRRGRLAAGGEPDTERAAALVLDEYRGGKLGRISLERPVGK